MERFHAIVVGAGAMGSSAAFHLARRAGGRAGAVLLLERHEIGHDRGSSHGESRIFRRTYHAATYVRLARESSALWEELERATGETLFFRTGDLFFGAAEGKLAAYEEVLSAEKVRCERLDAAALAARFPQVRLAAGERAIFQEEGGILAATRCVLAQVRAARALGAEVREREEVRLIDRSADPIRIETDRGAYACDRLVLAGGPWMARLLAELALPLRVTRQEVFFFAPGARPDAFRPDRFPVWVHLGAGTTADDIQFYGFPIFGRFALKLARFAAGGPGIDPDRVERAVSTEAAEECRAFLDRRFPGATDGRLVDGHTCLFTMTPDEDFVIDLHPDDPRVALAAGFSGHGFKFASAVGRALAGLALEGRAGVAAIDEDRGRFAATRFGRRAAPPGPS